jgi:hypothetical protein
MDRLTADFAATDSLTMAGIAMVASPVTVEGAVAALVVAVAAVTTANL